MTFEDRLKALLGELQFQNLGLIAQVDQLTAKVKELETPKPSEPKIPAEDHQRIESTST